MCGIGGFNFKTTQLDVFQPTSHRGPDLTAFNTYGAYTLGHNRLSIVDHNPESNQPFVSADGNYVIVYNGEVYNHQEIRSQLESKYSFKTASDTEAVLYNYIEKGPACLADFRGMFAFAIYDIAKNELFCARDRSGIKPFVYYHKDDKFIFASEIKVILKVLEQKPEVDPEALIQYLEYLYIPAPKTIFKNIQKLPPAHYLQLDANGFNIKRYWDPGALAGSRVGIKEADALHELDHLLNETMSMQMIADVELGAFLSGGIDSSTILYYMHQNASKPVNTYTLGFAGAKRYDERNDAKTVAAHFNTNHQEIMINPDAAQLLPKMVKHFDEPFGNPTALLIHELTKETAKHATVALAGDGGDEIFGGYPRYEAALLANKLDWVPRGAFKAVSSVAGLMPESTSGNHKLRRAKTFMRSMALSNAERYERWVGYFAPEELQELLMSSTGATQMISKHWKALTIEDSLYKTSIIDQETFLPGNILAYGDAMSMANSFEVRVPLIDHKIIEFMMSIDSKYRISQGTTKYLLKQLLKDRLPDHIINKPKLGLNPPMGIWLREDLHVFIEDHLGEASVNSRGYFNYAFIAQMIKEHNSGKRDRSLYIWALIVLEEWFRQYID